jgi:hypothetical protein
MAFSVGVTRVASRFGVGLRAQSGLASQLLQKLNSIIEFVQKGSFEG